MTNYIDKIMNIQSTTNIQTVKQKEVLHSKVKEGAKPQKSGTNILERFLQNQGMVMAATQVNAPDSVKGPSIPYKNNLRTRFQNNEAVIMGVIMRSLGAKDNNGNQLLRKGDIKGNFNNAVERLDELKRLGINTLHVLPIHPPGKTNAFGTAGSVYAPADFLKVDPALDDPNDPKNVKEEFRNFINECHKRGMSVMLDLPSCASYDLFKKRKELMAFEKDGTPKTPGGWDDIRMFDAWKDESNRELNPDLLKMHLDYIDLYVGDLGVDGIRADVARAKPTEFWDIVISHARKIDPECAFLAESYTNEDAEAQTYTKKDRPQDALNAGFDSIYGQWHIFHDMHTASEVINYVKENLEMSFELPRGKSLIGSFGTHDDVSIMNHGGVNYVNLVSGMQATLPMLNPYYFDGYQTGDYYDYDFNKDTIDKETDTDSNNCMVHPHKPDIFNFSRPLIGKHPEIGEFMKSTLDLRINPKYHKIITHGSFIPLKVEGNKRDQIIAFARHLNGRTLIVVANKDVNSSQSGSILIPGLSENQKLVNLFPSYGDESTVQSSQEKLNVNLGKARIHLFEVDTPDIEKSGIEVFRQNI